MAKRYWAVTSSFYDSGRVIAAITNVIEADKKPADEYHITKRCDVYVDWFDSEKAAIKQVNDAKNA